MERVALTRLLDTLSCTQREGGVRLLQDPQASSPAKAEARERLLQAAAENSPEGWLLLPTGGTGGVAKWARHDESTLGAAVGGFCRHFQIVRVNSVDVLPSYHVSGLMARVRAFATGGRHVPWDWKDMLEGRFPPLTREGCGWVISLVPTQLQRLLDQPPALEFLRGFRAIFLGGAPAWASLLERARVARLPIAPCYGMTETAAMVAALDPESFRSGAEGVGAPLPHASITLEEGTGQVMIEAASLFRGYAGHPPQDGPLRTDDMGHWAPAGGLVLDGRSDDVVITGGKKVSVGWLESELRTLLPDIDLAVVGVSDPLWGERIVACVPAGMLPSQPAQHRIEAHLQSFQRPKEWIELSPWPRNAQGKIERAKLRDLLAARR